MNQDEVVLERLQRTRESLSITSRVGERVLAADRERLVEDQLLSDRRRHAWLCAARSQRGRTERVSRVGLKVPVLAVQRLKVLRIHRHLAKEASVSGEGAAWSASDVVRVVSHVQQLCGGRLQQLHSLRTQLDELDQDACRHADLTSVDAELDGGVAMAQRVGIHVSRRSAKRLCKSRHRVRVVLIELRSLPKVGGQRGQVGRRGLAA